MRPKDTISTTQKSAKFFVARSGVFLEKEYFLRSTSGRKVELDEVLEPQDILDEGRDDVP